MLWITTFLSAKSADNYGLVALQREPNGYVIYDFCSELGWNPCTQAQAPRLKAWYHVP